MKLKLDFSSFEKALKQLQEAHQVSSQDSQNELLRDGCIQRFEYSYELACKALKRYLQLSSPQIESVDQSSFRNLLRLGAEQGLIEQVEAWLSYREARNLTSHTYDFQTAVEVFQTIPLFIKSAQYLLKALQKKAALL